MDEHRLEQVQAIRESAAAVAREGTLERVCKLRFAPLGFDPAVWRRMAEWAGLGSAFLKARVESEWA